MGPPFLNPTSAGTNIAGGNIAPGSYIIVITNTNAWGESLPSAQVTVVVAPGQNAINLLYNGAPGNTGNGKVYVLNGALGVPNNQAIVIPFSDPTFSGVIPILNVTSSPNSAGLPPSRSSAFLPDTDGRFASVGTLYRWLNSALNTAAYICKGIPDTSGIQMVQQQGMYTMPGIWEKIENMWFDGYPLAADSRGGGFYRNVLTGISFIIILQTNSDRQIIELQPQPDRTGGSTTLSVEAGINDTQFSLASSASIGLSLGMAQVGTEVISYGTLAGPGFIGCARGLGGTQQQAWPVGTPVTELNFRFGGLRLNQQVQYLPGQSNISLQVPPGWRPALVDYIIGKAREGERKGPEAKEYLQKFTSFLKDYMRGTRQTAGPRQLGSVTPAGDGYPSASSGGRIIVP